MDFCENEDEKIASLSPTRFNEYIPNLKEMSITNPYVTKKTIKKEDSVHTFA